MKSELSFLLDLILDEQVPQPVKNKLVVRIREVEKSYAEAPVRPMAKAPKMTQVDPVVAAQSPSMQRIMAQNPDLIPAPPTPTTPAAAQALQARAALLAGAGKEKPEPGRTTPRKI